MKALFYKSFLSKVYFFQVRSVIFDTPLNAMQLLPITIKPTHIMYAHQYFMLNDFFYWPVLINK